MVSTGFHGQPAVQMGFPARRAEPGNVTGWPGHRPASPRTTRSVGPGPVPGPVRVAEERAGDLLARRRRGEPQPRRRDRLGRLRVELQRGMRAVGEPLHAHLVHGDLGRARGQFQASLCQDSHGPSASPGCPLVTCAQPISGTGEPVQPGAEHPGQRLGAEADAEHRHGRGQHPLDERQLGGQPGQRVVVGGQFGAEDGHGVAARCRGQWLASVQRHGLDAQRPARRPVRQQPGRGMAAVLDHQQPPRARPLVSAGHLSPARRDVASQPPAGAVRAGCCRARRGLGRVRDRPASACLVWPGSTTSSTTPRSRARCRPPATSSCSRGESRPRPRAACSAGTPASGAAVQDAYRGDRAHHRHLRVRPGEDRVAPSAREFIAMYAPP